jgi:hypothetical protein
LITGLVLLASYPGDHTPVAGGRVMAQSPPKVGNTTQEEEEPRPVEG